MILERVFWFVNGGLSGGVGGDGGYVGSTPRTWIPACAGKTEGGVGDDGGYVRIHAPHLDSGPVSGYGVAFLRRKDGLGGLRPWVWMTGVWLGFGDWRNDVEPLPRTGEGTFETGS